MNKKELLKKLNKKIDELVLKGKTKSEEYKRLCKIHYALVTEMGIK